MKFSYIYTHFVLTVIFLICEFSVTTSNEIFRARSLFPLQLKYPKVPESIANGVDIAKRQCQETFEWERWNCPEAAFNRHRIALTKETAYIKAVTAAGIVFSLTRNCSNGEIEGCNCNRKDKIPLKTLTDIYKSANAELLKPSNKNATVKVWLGCSDDTTFAIDVTNQLLKEVDKGLDARTFVTRHNQNVGIEVTKHTMVKKCKCHGMSGSCSLKTCWMELAPFVEISRKLKHLHKTAVRVTYDEVQRSIFMGNSASNQHVEMKTIEGTKHKLIYIDSSPDYCVPNLNEGYQGTRGRICSRTIKNVTTPEKNGCKNVCKQCGYRVSEIQKTITKQCNCTFSWCCAVKCQTCEEVVTESSCA